MTIERRQVLAGVLATASLGLTAAAAEALTVNEAGNGSDAAVRGSIVELRATELRIAGAGRAAPGVGESTLLSAALVAEGTGARGSLHGVRQVIASSGVVGVAAPTSIETHHFVFGDGTLVGTGTTSLDDNVDNFVVLGGTGIYAGASGSYTALQSHLGLGGNGSALYRFALLPTRGI